MLRRVFLALPLALFFNQMTSGAQVATGAYPLGTYDSLGADTINVGSLNVMLNIPVLHKVGRAGTNFTYDLLYNGAIWTPTGGAWSPDVNWGWAGNTQVVTGLQTEVNSYSMCKSGSRSIPGVNTTLGVVYHDSFGIAHHFAGRQQTNVCTGGFTDTLTNTWSTDHQYYYTRSGLQNARGAIFNPPINSPAGAGSYTDTNGNRISTDGSGNFTDTTGNVVLSISGTAPANQLFNYTDASGTSRKLTISYGTYTIVTNFGCSSISDYSAASTPLINAITLPDGSGYSFTYEHASGTDSGSVTGRLASITLPAGGVVSYTYTGANNGINCADGSPLGITRTLTSATGTPQRTYTRNLSGTNSHTMVVNEVGDHLDYDFVPGIDSTSTATGMYQTNLSVTTSGTGTPLLAQQTCYNSASLPCTTQSLTLPITSAQQYPVLDGATQSSTSASYDIAGNYLGSTTYDFGTATAPGSSLLTDTRTYLNGMLNSDTVSDSTGEISSTGYTYDSAALHSTSGIPQHTSGTNYGNLTQVSVYTSPGNNSNALTTNYTYYDTGSLYSQTSPSGGVTTYSYDSTNTHPTTVTPPDPNSAGMGSTYTYDAYLGQPASATNPNGTVSSITTSDGSGHPAQVVVANGATTLAKATSMTYPTESSTISYQGSSTPAETDTYYDSYGRPIRTATQSETGHWYVVDTCYDPASRVSFKSYPYAATSLGSPTCSGAGDTYTYDALGRTLRVTHADSPSTSVRYIYYGNATEVTNENGVAHIYQSDGAGRTTIVCELTSATMNGASPGNCGTLISGTGFATTYRYSRWSTTVTQGSQSRLFTVDGAGRTTRKQEPEGNWTSYAYSSNAIGNLVTRQKPKAGQTDVSGSAGTTTTTTTQYDQLGRVVSITYDDGVTPTKTFTYDVTPSGSSFGVGYAKGMMTAAATAAGASTLFSYDAMGRVQNTSQCIPGWCGTGTPPALTRSYNYNWTGNPTGESYGTAASGTFASLSYGVNLDGQLTSITGGQDTSVASSLYSAPVQTPYGPTAVSLGNGVGATMTYDTFGRRNGLGLTLGSTHLYAYTATWSGQQLVSSSDSVNGSGNYTYDGLNHLQTASIGSSAGSMNMTWAYDRYGNRLSQTASGSYPVSVSQPSFTVDATTNRLTSSGYTYDAVGNLRTDVGGNTYSYDADGNLIGITGGTFATFTTFTFDALNERVLTVIGGTARAYGFNLAGQRATVWDGSGNLISAQYYAGGQPFAYYLAADGHVRFQHQDWLGTERFRTTYTGTAEGSFSSLPFGDSTSTASGSDTDVYHYAGLDQDSADLQHATYRQYSATQGRWLRPDPYDGSYDMSDPQSMNRYTYVSDLPLSFLDSLGLDEAPIDPNNPPPCQPNDPNCTTSYGGVPPSPPLAITPVAYPVQIIGNSSQNGGGQAPNNGQSQQIAKQISDVNNCTSQANAAMNSQASVTPTGQNLIDGTVAFAGAVAIAAPGLPEDAPLLPIFTKAAKSFVVGSLFRSVSHALTRGAVFLGTYHTCLASSGVGNAYNPYSPF